MFDLLYRYRNLSLAVLLLLQPLLLILMGRHAEDRQMGPLGDAFLRTISTGQAAAYEAVGGVGDFWDDYIRLVDVNQENQQLRADNARLEEERVRLLGVMQENARLRHMVEFLAAEPALELRAAHVIAKDITPYFRVTRLQLDLGEGVVHPGMPVVTSSGLVGQISLVAGDYCDVLLTLDPESRVDILVQRNRARGILVGLGNEDDYSARISYLMQRDEVVPGDVIVTSGLAGRFPRELVVGHIIEVIDGGPGLYQEVIVRPSVDFSRLEEVFVITGSDQH